MIGDKTFLIDLERSLISEVHNKHTFYCKLSVYWIGNIVCRCLKYKCVISHNYHSIVVL